MMLMVSLSLSLKKKREVEARPLGALNDAAACLCTSITSCFRRGYLHYKSVAIRSQFVTFHFSQRCYGSLVEKCTLLFCTSLNAVLDFSPP